MNMGWRGGADKTNSCDEECLRPPPGQPPPHWKTFVIGGGGGGEGDRGGRSVSGWYTNGRLWTERDADELVSFGRQRRGGADETQNVLKVARGVTEGVKRNY